MIEQNLSLDGIPLIRLSNAHLQVDIAPSVGGRIVSLHDKASEHEFLWRNPGLRLETLPPGSEYDPNFFGGIDELLPTDIPERLNGLDCPDHGELWTTPLNYHIESDTLALTGQLPLTGLHYEKRLTLRPDSPHLDIAYRIENRTSDPRTFLWKLHAALNVGPGDKIESPARTMRVVDLAWSRWNTLDSSTWPHIAGQRADIVPPRDGTLDFLFLYDLTAGFMGWRNAAGTLEFTYSFDKDVFPYSWYFASYGGFDGHYFAILEPCTTMPLSVNEAAALGQCSHLEPGESLATAMTIYAGAARTQGASQQGASQQGASQRD